MASEVLAVSALSAALFVVSSELRASAAAAERQNARSWYSERGQVQGGSRERRERASDEHHLQLKGGQMTLQPTPSP